MTNDVLITDELVEKAVDAARSAGKGCSPLEDMAYVTIRAALAVVVPEILRKATAACEALIEPGAPHEIGPETHMHNEGVRACISSIRLLGG